MAEPREGAKKARVNRGREQPLQRFYPRSTWLSQSFRARCFARQNLSNIARDPPSRHRQTCTRDLPVSPIMPPRSRTFPNLARVKEEAGRPHKEGTRREYKTTLPFSLSSSSSLALRGILHVERIRGEF